MHPRFVAAAERACGVPGCSCVLVGGEHPVLELLVVARSGWLQDKRALAVQAPGPLRSVAGMTVLEGELAAAARTDVDQDGWCRHARTANDGLRVANLWITAVFKMMEQSL